MTRPNLTAIPAHWKPGHPLVWTRPYIGRLRVFYSEHWRDTGVLVTTTVNPPPERNTPLIAYLDELEDLAPPPPTPASHLTPPDGGATQPEPGVVAGVKPERGPDAE